MKSRLMNQLKAFGIQSNLIGLDNGTLIKLNQVVRYVPGKRLVCQAEALGNRLYVKLFFGKRAIAHSLRDAHGINLLDQYQILTPKLIYQGSANGIQVLVFEEIVAATNAESLYQSGNQQERQSLAMALVEVLANHHSANLIQSDLYLKNFLVKDGLIYTLDGDGIRKYSFLGKTKALKNLAALMSKFDVLDCECWIKDLIAIYTHKRNWSVRPSQKSMQKMVFGFRVQAAIKYADLKVFRQCTDVNVEQTPWLFKVTATQVNFNAFELTPLVCDDFLNNYPNLKTGNTCTVGSMMVDKDVIIIKRYNIKSLWHAFNRAFRQTRAAASWSNAHRLKILGIPTPQPIALIEQRFFGLRGKAYFLSEYLDAPDVKAYFARLKNKKQQNDTIRNIVNLFYRLHLLKLSHGDMKSSNIKMLDGTPWLIDLDSMRQHRFDYFALKAHVEDLRRFMLNWQDQSTLYNMFVKEFHMVYLDHKALRLAGLIH